MFLDNFVISMAKFYITLRIRGIESIMAFSGLMNYLVNIGSNFGDISDAEFSFTEMNLVKQNYDALQIQEQIKDYYVKQAVNQFYQVLGSQDIIGNPSGFMANVNKGTETFYNEPLEGLVEGKF